MEPISFYRPDIREEDAVLVREVLFSGWITTGSRVLAFEEALRQYSGTDHAVCFSSATAAMEILLRHLGVGPGDRVITTPYTYAATVNVILHCGALPVLADTLPGTWEIDPARVAALLDENVKAVVPVDFAGWPCDADALAAAVRGCRIRAASPVQEALGRPLLMDDAAHALGSSLRGERMPGALDAAAYSFHAVKNVTSAEGGALVFRELPGVLNGAAVANLKTLALHGQNKSAHAKAQGGGWEYDILMPGYKCNLTDLHAALGLAQLARYPETLERRRTIVARYNAAFRDNPRLAIPPFTDPDRECAWHIYPLILADQDRAGRDTFIQEMEKRGIGVNVHFRLIPEFSAYRGMFDIREFAQARAMSEREVTLPLYPGLRDDEVERVIAAVRESLETLPATR